MDEWREGRKEEIFPSDSPYFYFRLQKIHVLALSFLHALPAIWAMDLSQDDPPGWVNSWCY